MSLKKPLESSVGKIEKRLNADPLDRSRMVQARLLVAGLRDSNSRKRAEVREQARSLGEAALPAFLSALTDTDARARWQAEALSMIHNPVTAPDLINAMDDDDFGVRWLVAEGLIAMGPACLEGVLRGLCQNFESVRMREGVLHILHALTDDGYYSASIDELQQVLQHSATAEEIAWVAQRAWEDVRMGGIP
jgi:HEAT repeat protein